LKQFLETYFNIAKERKEKELGIQNIFDFMEE